MAEEAQAHIAQVPAGFLQALVQQQHANQALQALQPQPQPQFNKDDLKSMLAEATKAALAESNAALGAMGAKLDKLTSIQSSLSHTSWKDPAKETSSRQMTAIRVASTLSAEG
jgi:hypothetical protein